MQPRYSKGPLAASKVKTKQSNSSSNSAEIKFDLSAKCRLNNDGKNVLKYKASDGWEITIPLTPEPTFLNLKNRKNGKVKDKLPPIKKNSREKLDLKLVPQKEVGNK